MPCRSVAAGKTLDMSQSPCPAVSEMDRNISPIITGELWSRYRDLTQLSDCPGGEILFGENDPVSVVVLIERGCVGISRQDKGRAVLVAVRAEGSVLGGNAALLQFHHLATATTLGPCRCQSMPADLFRQLCRSDLAVAQWYQEVAARENCYQLMRLARQGGSDGRDRLETLLIELFRAGHWNRPDGSAVLSLGLTVQDIADLVHLTRERTSRILRQFRTQGLLVRAKGRFIIPAKSTLRATVSPPSAMPQSGGRTQHSVAPPAS